MFVTLDGIDTDINPLQSLNVSCPMLVTLGGILTLVSPQQFLKAELPMLTTSLGIVNDASPLQSEKALSPMFVTLDGIEIDVKPLQPSNAPSPMLVTPDGIVTSPFTPKTSVRSRFEQSKPLFELYLGFAGSTTKDLRPPQSKNECRSMFVTLDGIATLANSPQLENALYPMLVTPSGIVTEDGHLPLYLYSNPPPKITMPSGKLL